MDSGDHPVDARARGAGRAGGAGPGRHPQRSRVRRLAAVWLPLFVVFTFLAPLVLGVGGRAGAAEDEEDLVQAGAVIGRHYRQTGGGTGLGYDVREPFFARLGELGGPSAVGFPASAPFRGVDACTYQLFQVMVLQACPDQPLQLANTFQILGEAGADSFLAQLGIGFGERDTGASFEEAVRIRLGWLEDSAIRERYLSQCGGGDVTTAWQFCGLPMNRPQLFGAFASQRFQRIAFQRWLVDGPAGIRAGDVSPILGGDLMKASGVVSGPAVAPHPLAQPPALATVLFSLVQPTPTPVPAAPDAVPAPVAAAPPAADFRERATLNIVQLAVDFARRSAPAAFSAGRDGDDIFAGDAVRTDARGDALVTYFQGTTAEVGPNSVLVVERLDLGPAGAPLLTLRQTAGQVIHRLTRALRSGSEYRIETPSATAVVRGTVIRITVAVDGGTVVEPFDGTASVTSAGVTRNIPSGFVTEVQVVQGVVQPPLPPASNPAPPPPLVPPPLTVVAGQVGVCHFTRDLALPYVFIRVAPNSAEEAGHAQHAGDTVGVASDADCPQTVPAQFLALVPTPTPLPPTPTPTPLAPTPTPTTAPPTPTVPPTATPAPSPTPEPPAPTPTPMLVGPTATPTGMIDNFDDNSLSTALWTAINPSPITNTIVAVDTTGDVGRYTSLALDSAGNPVIAYHTPAGELKLARCGNSTCTASNTITVVDSGAAGTLHVGDYASLALASGDVPVISYYDETTGDLKLARCGNTTCTSGNTITTVHASGNVGQYTSLKLNSTGKPVISYYDVTNGDLRLVICDMVDCSGTGQTFRILDSTGDVGQYTSLALASGDIPVVSYYDVTNDKLKLVRCGDATCSAGNTITTPFLSGSAGQYNSLALNSYEHPIISFYNATSPTNGIGVLRCHNTTCVSPTTTSIRSPVGGQYTSLKLRNGAPVISFYDPTKGDLLGMVCGNSGCTGGASRLVSLDTVGDVGQYTSLAVASGGIPVVSYYDFTNGDLKFGRCASPGCFSTQSTVLEAGQQLQLRTCSSGSCQETFDRSGVTSERHFELQGPFDLQVDFSGFQPVTSTGGSSFTKVKAGLSLKRVLAGDLSLYKINRVSSCSMSGGTTTCSNFYEAVDPSFNIIGSFDSTETSGKLRITRDSANVLRFYRHTGTDWAQLTPLDGQQPPTESQNLKVALLLDRLSANTPAAVNFDNVMLASGTRVAALGSWTALPATTTAARDDHSAVWTGNEMIVWGGWAFSGAFDVSFNDGARYDRNANTWTAVSTTGAPAARRGHTAVWTNSEMVIWGGGLNTGGRYDPVTNAWNATSTTNAPSARTDNTAVRVRQEMIVWGGRGPSGGADVGDGARYNFVTDTWAALPTSGAPSARRNHTAVRAGTEMIIWGGCSGTGCGTLHNNGARYNQATDTWTPISTANAPIARRDHTAVWTGSEMIVWGGFGTPGGSFARLNDGGRYNPSTDSWTSLPAAPVAREDHAAFWTGSEMIVWGGFDGTAPRNDGHRYDPAANAWFSMQTTGAAPAQSSPVGVWTGSEMIIWGGQSSGTHRNDGARYHN